MGLNGEKWVRIFDIPDISSHKKGFTLYKVISMLYPESCPDAITKLTVWKRYNDFKKLYREINVARKRLGLDGKIPPLPGGGFFKRFDEDLLQERRQCILNFLDYIGSQQQLFMCTEFVKFFETSHTPISKLDGNISSIRSDLHLPEDPEYVCMNSDDERTISDTDSITTLSSLSPYVQTDLMDSLICNKTRSSLSTQNKLKAADTISIATTIDSITLLDGQIYPTPPNTPENYVQYIIDASIHINIASELENNKKYDEAFLAYKTAIDILIKYGKDDKNYDRKQMVRHKTEKYLIRAEKIYNMYLAPEVRNLKNLEITSPEIKMQRPMSDLYKYKVVRVISSGMLVLHSDLQQFFYVKVISKANKFLNDNLVLPENVPYMVRLHNYFNCDNALFLVLEYCRAQRLWDYITQNSSADPFDPVNQPPFVDLDASEEESEQSFSDLINSYTKSKALPRANSKESTDESFVKVEHSDVSSSKSSDIPNIMDAPLACATASATSSRRKLSEMSSIDVDCEESLRIPIEDVTKWAAQLLVALEKLHQLGIVCKDIQPHNLLIGEDKNLLLTYMCNVKDLHDVLSEKSDAFVAPEIYSFGEITDVTDWWCYGSILYELLVGMPLHFVHPEGLSINTNVKIPKFVSPEGRSLLRQLLTYDPVNRLGYGINGTDNIKSHPFFARISWDTIYAKYKNN